MNFIRISFIINYVTEHFWPVEQISDTEPLRKFFCTQEYKVYKALGIPWPHFTSHNQVHQVSYTAVQDVQGAGYPLAPLHQPQPGS